MTKNNNNNIIIIIIIVFLCIHDANRCSSPS